MGEYTLQITDEVTRNKARDLVNRSPANTYITFTRNKSDTRSTQQNKMMWALLNIISNQIRWNGNEWGLHKVGARYSAEAWKVVFASSIVKETNWIPDLHGGMLPLNPATSKLNVGQFTLLTELIISQAAKWGIDIQDIVDA